uniref:Uncharacterized protein n=1 Tax=Leersia perrieri TaxID=77586 RepID=A0A0D9VD90_9ORYZ
MDYFIYGFGALQPCLLWTINPAQLKCLESDPTQTFAVDPNNKPEPQISGPIEGEDEEDDDDNEDELFNLPGKKMNNAEISSKQQVVAQPSASASRAKRSRERQQKVITTTDGGGDNKGSGVVDHGMGENEMEMAETIILFSEKTARNLPAAWAIDPNNFRRRTRKGVHRAPQRSPVMAGGRYGPAWQLVPLLGAKFFMVCPAHRGMSHNEFNHYCLTCAVAGGIAACCQWCIAASHPGHEVVQVRWSSYHNVVCVTELERAPLDLARVQTYMINCDKVVFLNTWHKAPRNGKCVAAAVAVVVAECEVCGRGLLHVAFLFCSSNARFGHIS